MAKGGLQPVAPRRPNFGRIVALAAVLLSVAGCASTGGGRAAATDELISPEDSIAAGDEAARRGDFERALAHYVRAVGVEETADAWLRVGAASTQLKHSERALHAYLKVVELDPAHAEGLEGAGLEYLTLKQADAARDLLTKVVELDARRWRSHNGLGILADQAGEHAAAIAHYEAALQVNPSSPMLLNNLGYSRYLAGDLEQASRDLYAATRLSADYEPAWSNLAVVYAHRGWYAEAVNTLARTTDKATAHNDIGYIAFRRGDLEASEQLLSEAVRLSPVYYETAHRNLEAVRLRMQAQQGTASAPSAPAGGFDPAAPAAIAGEG